MKQKKPLETHGYMVAGMGLAPFYGWSLKRRDLVYALKARGVAFDDKFYRIVKVKISELA